MSRKCYLNKSSHSAIHLIVELTVTGWFHCPFKILLSLTFVQGLLVFLTFFSRWWKLNRIATRREFPCVVMTTNRALSLWCPNESQWWACSSGVQLDQSQWCFSNHGQGSWLWMTVRERWWDGENIRFWHSGFWPWKNLVLVLSCLFLLMYPHISILRRLPLGIPCMGVATMYGTPSGPPGLSSSELSWMLRHYLCHIGQFTPLSSQIAGKFLEDRFGISWPTFVFLI